MGTQIIVTTVILTTLISVIFLVTVNFRHAKKDLHDLDFKNIATQLMALIVWVAILGNIFLVDNDNDLKFNLSVFIFSVVIGILLIKNLFKEIKTSETIDRLIKKVQGDNIKLKKLDRQKTEFVSLASHQLRGPLSIIQGYTSMVMDNDYGPVPEHLKTPIENIQRSSEKLGHLINDYLNVAKIEKGEMQYSIDSVNLKELLREVVDDFQMLAKDHKVGLIFDCDYDKSILIKADKVKTKQIFSNLIENGIKYTKEGSVTVKCNVTEEKITVSIKDTGIGIQKEKLQSIFGKFARAEEAIKMDVGGTGLGLFVAKIMTEAQGGKIWVESEGIMKGATFYVEMPLFY